MGLGCPGSNPGSTTSSLCIVGKFLNLSVFQFPYL